jgi:Trk K+ transport system NAD-binding subunit
MHTYLRKFILQNAIIKEIAIFPSSFFPGVNFGYSKLSIITLEKASNNRDVYNNTIKIFDNFKDPNELIIKKNVRITMIKQEDIFKNADYAFIFSNNQYFDRLIRYSSVRIGDVADCVTGIYTGDDKKYIKVKDNTVKNGKNYQLISGDEIHQSMSGLDLNGLNGINSYIPIIKGGNTRYLKQDLWYINWSKEAVALYKTNKKSRFQNSQYYFKQGLAVPMVSSNSVTASLLNHRIFDQSIVGIFPKNDEYILFLLAFFNTSICTQLLRMINPSANNSANYIKKIPIIIPDYNTLIHINKLVELLLLEKEHNEKYYFIENELNNIFNAIFYENQNYNIKVNKQMELFA